MKAKLKNDPYFDALVERAFKEKSKFDEIRLILDQINEEEGFPSVWNSNYEWLHYDLRETIYFRFLNRSVSKELVSKLGQYECVEYSDNFLHKNDLDDEWNYWSVYYFHKYDIFIKFVGCKFSDNEHDCQFESLFEVIPYNKVVTFYKRKD